MSEDKRETILAAIVDAAKTVFPAANVFRNTLQIPEAARPACVILDADETAEDFPASGRATVGRPVIVALAPEIHIILGNTSDDVGTELNGYRRQLVKALTTALPLVAACFNGDIRFQSFATGLSAGRNMESQGLLAMEFRYVLRPEKL
jgi:hypothetical protein